MDNASCLYSCVKRMREPYIMPCGHTFCLRPCLLPDDKVVKPRCMHCQKEFEATKLRPNYNVVLRSQRLSSQREHELTQTGLVEKGNADEAEVLAGESWTEEVPSLTISCSTCQRQIQPRLLVPCEHCQREVCVQCCATHRDSVSIIRLQVVMSVMHLS